MPVFVIDESKQIVIISVTTVVSVSIMARSQKAQLGSPGQNRSYGSNPPNPPKPPAQTITTFLTPSHSSISTNPPRLCGRCHSGPPLQAEGSILHRGIGQGAEGQGTSPLAQLE